MNRPILIAIAGPNRAGKTTITSQIKRHHWSEGVEYLNPDDVALQHFGGWEAQSFKQAADWSQSRREQLLAARQGVAFETVFSTSEKLDYLQRAKEAGYFLRFFFIGTSTPDINVRRIERRVEEGGHDVPRDKIVSR